MAFRFLVMRIRLFLIPDPNCSILDSGSASKYGFQALGNMIRVVHLGFGSQILMFGSMNQIRTRIRLMQIRNPRKN